MGDNIFIHGNALSAGCLAVGDKAIDELFVLIGKIGRNQAEVIIAPTDFRKRTLATSLYSRPWVPALYKQIQNKLNQFQNHI